MISKNIEKRIVADDLRFEGKGEKSFQVPKYDPRTHYLDLTRSDYYRALLVLRHYFKVVSEDYFSVFMDYKNIDLFILTSSVSSPLGPGSDSEAIPIKFGKIKSYLVDSSQFGFEPILINSLEKGLYCYFPSMRGEDFNERHLNQFFHCEVEIRGSLGKLIPIIEGYVKSLCQAFLLMPNIVNKISVNGRASRKSLEKIVKSDYFNKITFDEAIRLLIDNKKKHLINFTKFGKDMTADGELEIMKILKTDLPVWVTGYDRDRVPFYQKPDKKNKNKVLNADLLFPSIIEDSFSGEVIGCGQRQDNAKEMIESIKRQGIKKDPYLWYINLRKHPNYKTTSGFGLGVERFIAWALCQNDIKNVIFYPRLKNIDTLP